jgi:hypothetical protein
MSTTPVIGSGAPAPNPDEHIAGAEECRQSWTLRFANQYCSR